MGSGLCVENILPVLIREKALGWINCCMNALVVVVVVGILKIVVIIAVADGGRERVKKVKQQKE